VAKDDAFPESTRLTSRQLLGEALSRLKRIAPRGLSTKLLLYTILFVMLAEVLIFVPSIANFRVNWLNDRLMAARLAALAADGRPGGGIPEPMRMALLGLAQVKSVVVKQRDQRRLVLEPDGPIVIDASFDLTPRPDASPLLNIATRVAYIRDALAVFLMPHGRILRVAGKPELSMAVEKSEIEYVEIIIPEAKLRSAMITHSLNILALSIAISITAAAMMYAILSRLLVRPILRLADTMVAFSKRPEDASRVITPSGRNDEIGVAEQELQRMQRDLQATLQQQKRLAALGLAVAKIAHDLRNLLASTQLISDRLATLKDPQVQRFAPKLIVSLDRAIEFCNDTLRYGRTAETVPMREMTLLEPVVREVADGLGLPRATITLEIDMEPALEIDADHGQLYRLLNNLVRNSVGVLERQETSGEAPTTGTIRISAVREGALVRLHVADTGPGLPAKARDTLFQAFHGSTTTGGSGLGLAIAAEIVAAHGGTIVLLDSARGAVFEIVIPDRRRS
jgi:signal transduction histidine kinase